MMAYCFRLCVTLLLVVVLTACQAKTAPLEFAPDGDIVQKAIALQLEHTQTRLSQQLKATLPKIDLKQIQVNTLEPIVISELPAYHLQGTYHVTLTLPRQTVTQKKNPFEIYLQRQAEGKTWRLLEREVKNGQNGETQWASYLIEAEIPDLEPDH
ncbi:MAG: hypothetical protein VKJ02_11865 [Snowella sp.]|nr:hypothetical protein [Snowella sp.]